MALENSYKAEIEKARYVLHQLLLLEMKRVQELQKENGCTCSVVISNYTVSRLVNGFCKSDHRFENAGRLTRIVRSRVKNAKHPAGTLFVTRPSKFGNHLTIVDAKVKRATHKYGVYYVPDNKTAVDIFRAWIQQPGQRALREEFFRTVKDENITYLGCYCKLDQPCHADVWIELWERHQGK